MVDIQRPSSVARNKKIRTIIYVGVGLVAIIGVTIALSKLRPADPTVDRASVWFDTVQRGPMVRSVRELGTLVPVEIRWIPAVTAGRVERIDVLAGTPVEPETVILELSNPSQTQAALEAESQLKAAQARLTSLRARLQTELLDQQSTAASVESEYKQARLQAEADAALSRENLISAIQAKVSMMKADNLADRDAVEQKRLAQMADSIKSQRAVQEEEVDRARALAALRRSEVAALKVRPGVKGMLQQVPVEVGALVAPGQNLARVADPLHLKAELKIAETQAKDVEIGQKAQVDTRNGIIPGKVSRIDPAAQGGQVTVDVALEGDLPKGARPDLQIDGTIELERLADVLFVGRPTYGQEQSVVGLFRLLPDGQTAERVKVTLGRASVNTIEVKAGLKVGDQVVLSDMSAWDAFDRVRIR
jgi:HlyD family secretion protein